MKRIALTFVFAAIGLSAASLRGQALDQVVPLQGTPLTGTIVAVSKTEVTVESRGTRRSLPINEIRRMSFADDPQELKRARDNITTGNFDAGLSDLKKINYNDIQRELVKQEYFFYRSYAEGRLALSGGGDKARALQLMKSFVDRVPDSHHFFEANELLGDLAVALEDYPAAADFYGAVASQAPWPDYQMRGAVLQGRALVAQGKFAEAQAQFDTVIAKGVDTPAATRQKRLAEVGKAVCLAETGEHQQALSMLEDIIAKNDPSEMELFGRAYNAIGRCYQKAGQTKDALLAYLHVDILFYGTPDVHAEALYHLSKLWAQLNKSDRAVSARNLLAERYAGSAWAKRE